MNTDQQAGHLARDKQRLEQQRLERLQRVETNATEGREPWPVPSAGKEAKKGRELGGGSDRNSAFIESRSNNANQGESRRIKVIPAHKYVRNQALPGSSWHPQNHTSLRVARAKRRRGLP